MRAALLLVVTAGVLSGALISCRGTDAANGPEATVESDGRIDCRIGSDQQFQRYCQLERTEGAEGTILVLRKPDGGFRRLQVTRDGRGVIAADGAEQAAVSIVGPNMIEVGIGGDAFRLPARVGPVPAASNAVAPVGNSH